jgi:hypothetical protein
MHVTEFLLAHDSLKGICFNPTLSFESKGYYLFSYSHISLPFSYDTSTVEHNVCNIYGFSL